MLGFDEVPIDSVNEQINATMPATVSNTNPNPLILAAENPPNLLPLLRSNPQLAVEQDEHGYSMLHAAASYNHLDLMDSLKAEFSIDPNIVDEDGETALFVVETVEAAQHLLEAVGTSPEIRNEEGITAEEKIRAEGDFVAVADYLSEVRERRAGGSRSESGVGADHTANEGNGNGHPPPLPPGVQMRIGTLEDEQNLGEIQDPELKARIEELAAREDFQGEDGQKQLRDVITDAVRGIHADEREVRRRTD